MAGICASPEAFGFNYLAIRDFAALARARALYLKGRIRSLWRARLPMDILNPSGGSYKQRENLPFRVDTPSARLESLCERSKIAAFCRGGLRAGICWLVSARLKAGATGTKIEFFRNV
jgi:hypothetical protein